jgi:hypothetical protein
MVIFPQNCSELRVLPDFNRLAREKIAEFRSVVFADVHISHDQFDQLSAESTFVRLSIRRCSQGDGSLSRSHELVQLIDASALRVRADWKFDCEV